MNKDNNTLDYNTVEIKALVQQVLYAVARASRDEDADRYVLALFTGATAGFSQALSGLEHLMLNGTMLRVLTSESARRLYGDVLEKRLMPWPNAEVMEKDSWFSQVQKCSGVVIPMLSVASLSRVCSMTPDTLAANIILQALFMGKPVVAAIDGAAPNSPDRKLLGLDQGAPALMEALAHRLLEFSNFGARLTWSRDLGPASLRFFRPADSDQPGQSPLSIPASRPSAPQSPAPPDFGPVRLVDAGHVKFAREAGTPIHTTPGAVVTPLAREMASGWGIEIIAAPQG